MSRRGTALTELVLVAWLFALVLLGLARFATAQGHLASSVADRVRGEELLRTTRMVLARELRYLATTDMTTLGPDSLGLRAVRGSGTVCGGGLRHLAARYRGIRWPDPAKDSLLLIDDNDPAGVAYALTSVAGSGDCPGALRLGLDRDLPGAPGGGLVLIFERGAYHVAGGALRYRRGRAGRQPLTEAVLDGGGFTRRAADGRVRAVHLSFDGDSLPRHPEPEHELPLLPAPEPASIPRAGGARP